MNNIRASMRLYSDAQCIHSHRVRLLLAEKNLTAEIDLIDPHNVPEDLIHLNPYNSVPTLIDRDLVLYDVEVITDYIDERYPHPPFMPVDPVSRAKARLTLYRIQQDWYSLLPALGGDHQAGASEARKTLRDSITASAELFSLKPYFLNDEYSLLDATVVPLLWRFKQYGIELQATARAVDEYARRMFARPQFLASLTEAERALR